MDNSGTLPRWADILDADLRRNSALEEILLKGIDHRKGFSVADIGQMLTKAESDRIDLEVSVHGSELQVIVPNDFCAVG